MKKGMILKITRQYALVLNEDAKVEKINLKPNVVEGQQIYYFEGDVYKMKPRTLVRAGALVASLLIVAIIATYINIGTGNQVYAQPHAVVTVDINPSLEIYIDDNNRVTKIVALNDDADKIVSDDFIGMKLDKALDLIISKAEKEGFLVEDGTVLISSVILDLEDEETEDDTDIDEETEETPDVDEDTDEEDQDDVEKTIQSFIERKTEQYEFLYAKGTEEALRASKSEGMSLGKYEMLKFLDEDITQAEIKEMKISEIADRKEAKDIEKADKNLAADEEKVVIDDEDSDDPVTETATPTIAPTNTPSGKSNKNQPTATPKPSTNNGNGKSNGQLNKGSDIDDEDVDDEDVDVELIPIKEHTDKEKNENGNNKGGKK